MTLFRPGDRVRISIPWAAPCSIHLTDSLPIRGARGTVDRVDERFGEHAVVVVFDLWDHGTQWMDRFTAAELVLDL